MTPLYPRLTSLPAAMRGEGISGLPAYRKVRELAIEGRFPAFQIHGIWHYDPTQVTTIASNLGLDIPAGRIA